MKKHLNYFSTYRFFVATQLRAELKRVCRDIQIPCRDTMKGRLKEECRDTMKGRLKEECRDIAKIVSTQVD